MSKSPLHLVAGVLAMGTLALGCAITDYAGRTADGDRTEAEAKLYGKEVAFGGFAADLDGTYSYTVKYDRNSGQDKVTIFSYHNPVFGSFSREGIVDRDGDDVQGSAGVLGGKFNNQFVAVDRDPDGNCGFFDNITQDKSSSGAQIALCILGSEEEIDRDMLLQAPFASLDDLLTQILDGTLSKSFTMEVTSITLNGTMIPLSGVSLDMAHNGLRPTTMALDGSQPGVEELLQGILANTTHGVGVTVGLGFDGGLALNLPAYMTLAFDHDVITALLP